MAEDIRSAFDRVASRYDAQRKWIIPGLDEYYAAAVWAAESTKDNPAILDVGAGTGLLSALLLEKFPAAALTLVDLSDRMLDVARERFAGRDVRYLTGDYSDLALGGPYDIIASALSIHHLPHEGKRQLYRKIFSALVPGGVFVNADQAAGETSWLDARFRGYWDRFVAESTFDRAELNAAMQRRDTLDKNAKLSDQLTWLRESGFSDVDIVYRNRFFVVIIGRKP
ncbi:MAG: methyltransferase domain-containing protein [Methanoregulaceae archaeon]